MRTRLAMRALTVAGAVSLGAACTAPPPSGGVPTDPTPEVAAAAEDPAGPDSSTVDLLAVEQLLALQREAAVAAAESAGAAANAAASLAVQAAQARLEQAEAALGAVQVAAAGAREARDEAAEEAELLQSRMALVASESFQVLSTAGDPTSGDPADLLMGGDHFTDRANGSAYGQVTLELLQRQLRESRRVLADKEAGLAGADEALVEAELEITAAGEALGLTEAEAQRIEAEVAAAVEQARSSGEVPFLSGSDGPTIMGPAVVGATDMAAFVQAKGSPHPSIDVLALARTFVAEGRSEGVRGDLAFVQAIIETGWFSYRNSMVDPEDHNYAGIGACDSCSDGYGYASMELGVRAQVQLLRAYAEPDLTSADYANPPVRTVPERLGVRGCCSTWMGLSGVWATGPGYGQKILKLYDDLVAFALARSQAV